MAKYLVLAKYSAAGAGAVVKEGYVARAEAVRTGFAAAGITQLGWWVVGNGEWDFAILFDSGDASPAKLAAVLTVTQSSGAFERASLVPLHEPADVDVFIRQGFSGYRAPGAET